MRHLCVKPWNAAGCCLHLLLLDVVVTDVLPEFLCNRSSAIGRSVDCDAGGWTYALVPVLKELGDTSVESNAEAKGTSKDGGHEDA